MSRARKILEVAFGLGLGGAELNVPLRKGHSYLKCRSCGYIKSVSSGIDTSALSPLKVETIKPGRICPACGHTMEVHRTSASVMAFSGGGRGTVGGLGGGLHGGAFS